MSQIENLREKLHNEMERGNFENILRVSQELDELILRYYLTDIMSVNKKSA